MSVTAVYVRHPLVVSNDLGQSARDCNDSQSSWDGRSSGDGVGRCTQRLGYDLLRSEIMRRLLRCDSRCGAVQAPGAGFSIPAGAPPQAQILADIFALEPRIGRVGTALAKLQDLPGGIDV